MPYTSYFDALDLIGRVNHAWRKYALKFGLLIVLIVSSVFVLHQVNRYEENAYEASGHTDSMDIASFVFQAKQDCVNKQNAIEKNRCEESINQVINRYIPALDLAAQDTMAKATRGILWISAIQAISGFVTVLFLFWTVMQTRSILQQSNQTTRLAEQSLSEAKKTTLAAEETLFAARSSERPRVFIELSIPELCSRHKEHYSFTFRLRNGGQTPAEYVHVFASNKKWGNVKTKEKLRGSKDSQKGVEFGFPILCNNMSEIDNYQGLPDDGHSYSILDIPKAGKKFYVLWFYNDPVVNQRMRGQIIVTVKPRAKPGAETILRNNMRDYRKIRSNWTDAKVIYREILCNIEGIDISYDNFFIQSVGPAVLKLN